MSFRLKFQYPVEDQSLYTPGAVEDFGGHQVVLRVRGRGNQSSPKENKGGGFRKLTADSLPKRGGGIRILQILVGGSGKFYCDTNKILRPPPRR